MVIQSYDPEWGLSFQRIKKVLLTTLADEVVTIEHIGSTAVEGLPAKPIIDLDIVYKKTSEQQLFKKLASLGYYHNGDQGIKDREVFKRKAGEAHPVLDSVRHHLYACPEGSLELRRHLLFRDALRCHPTIRNEYAQLKRQIAKSAGQDRKRYALLKEEAAKDFVESVISRKLET